MNRHGLMGISDTMKIFHGKLERKLHSRNGMSLTELLAAVAILLLVTIGLTTTVTLALNQYDESMRASESQTLYSTLKNVITRELAYTTEIEMSGSSVAFQSPDFAIKSGLSQFMNDGSAGEYGCILLGNSTESMNILGNKAYPRSLGANVESLSYDITTHYFTVEISIGSEDKEYFRETFQVKNVNETEPNE